MLMMMIVIVMWCAANGPVQRTTVASVNSASHERKNFLKKGSGVKVIKPPSNHVQEVLTHQTITITSKVSSPSWC